MRIIYELGLHIYAFIAFIVSPYNKKAHQWCSGRKESFKYLNSKIKEMDNILWMHCASLGEFEQGRPLIESIKKRYPEYKILLTFFSPSGYEIRKNYKMADYICYLPLDTRKNARKFINIVNPKKVFFIKYEFWMNYIKELSLHKIPLYLVSSIFNPEQLFFKKRIGASWYRKILFRVSYFFVQNQQSSDLLSNIGIKNTMIIGDTRFDRVAEIAAQGKKLPIIEKFKGSSKLIIAGSSWAPDEKLLTEYFNKNKKTKVIFAPHEVKESNINRIINSFHEPVLLYSKVNIDTDINNYRILIIDCVGILSSIYRYGDIAYIGGGFGVGIHNTLEAAIYNIPVLFGPNYKKFQEAVDLKEKGIAFPVSTIEELTTHFDDLINNDKKLSIIKERCCSFMQKNIGATDKVVSKVFEE